jgi:hypothetical protein
MPGTETPAGATRATATLEINDGEGTVTVRKLVSQGERLEISSGADSVTLDSLLLEALSWQRDRGDIAALLDEESAAADGDAVATDPVPAEGGDPVDDAPEITVSNEYSLATVRKVETANGEGVELSTHGRGTAITLGPAMLRELAAVEDTYMFSEWFRTPFGPEDTGLEGPL